MSVNYCDPSHVGDIQYYISSINTAICEADKETYLKKGYECSSIESMGKSYACDVKALKDKFTVANDDINARQAKIEWAFEKLKDSINGAFESYIVEVQNVQKTLKDEIDSEKAKFSNGFLSDIKDPQEYVLREEQNLANLLQNVDESLNPNSKDFTKLLGLISSNDLNLKNNEFEDVKFKINPIIMRDPVVPYIINKRQYTKDAIMAQIEITKPYETYVEKASPQIVKPPLITASPIIFQPMLHCFYLDKLYIYDISREKKYIVDAPPPEIFPSKNFPTAIIRDSIFICGGSSQEILALRSTFTFEMQTLEFIQRKSMLNGRCKHALAVVGTSRIYSIGGARGKIAIRECIKYDFDSDLWGQAPYLNYENCAMSAFTYRNRFIYTIGGINNSTSGFGSEMERLDIMNESLGWQRIDFRTNGWTSRYGMNVCQLSEQYFLVFGGANISYQNHCFLFDTENDSLLFISRMLQGAKFELQQPMPVLFNDSVYAIDEEKNLHIFNIKNNSWSLFKWAQWKPNATRSPVAREKGLRSYY